MPRDDPRLIEAQQIPIEEIVTRLNLQGLRRYGREMTGPCPACGGTDRFSINTAKNVFLCRHCKPQGGGSLKLIELAMGMRFRDALDWLMGPPVQVRAEERARRDGENQRKRQANDRKAERERERAIRAARKIWDEGERAAGSPVEGYLALRGLGDLGFTPANLRYHPALSYWAPGDGGAQKIHTGPAMLGAIRLPNTKVVGVHQTWFDLSRPKGKPDLGCDAKGEPYKTKKMRGSQKGNAIRLTRPADYDFKTLVMGEGIETTLTAALGDVYPGAAYWSGLSLGNMSGSRILHGKGMKYAGIPDMNDAAAFVPPPNIERMIFIQDGDSEPRSTRAKLEAGLRRAAHLIEGLQIQIVHAGEGQDLNDVVMQRRTDDDVLGPDHV